MRIESTGLTSTHSSRFGIDWRRVMLRGILTMVAGVSLAFAAIFNPDASILNAWDFSWLPAGGLFVLAIGLLECLDGALAKQSRDFILHWQNGILDAVVGGLIVLGISGHPERLSLLIAGYLFARGFFRLVLAQATGIRRKLPSLVGGGLSIGLGSLVWAEWPWTATWFLALCLTAEIGMRGIAWLALAWAARDTSSNTDAKGRIQDSPRV